MNSWHVIVSLAALGAFALVTAFTLPPRAGKRQGIHVGYGLAVALIAGAATWFWNTDYRVTLSAKKAEQLLDGHYQPEEFIHMAMGFLERYRNLYPDAYARAREYCELRNCTETFPEDEESEEARLRMNTLIEVALMLKQTMRGIAPPEPVDIHDIHYN